MKVWLVRYRTFIYQFNEAPDMDKFPFYEDVSEDMEKGLDYDDAFTDNCVDWVSVLNVENFLELRKQKDETIRCIETGDPYENSSEESSVTAQDVREYLVTASVSQLSSLSVPVNGVDPIVTLLNAFNSGYIASCLRGCNFYSNLKKELNGSIDYFGSPQDTSKVLASFVNALKESDMTKFVEVLTPKTVDAINKYKGTTLGNIINAFNKLTSINAAYILDHIEPRIINIIVEDLKVRRRVPALNYELTTMTEIDSLLKGNSSEIVEALCRELIVLYPELAVQVISNKIVNFSGFNEELIKGLSDKAYNKLVITLCSSNSVRLKEALPPFILTNPEEKEVPSVLNSDKNNWLI